MNQVTVEWLRTIEAIKDVPAEQLQWMIDNSKHQIIPPGGFLFEPDTAIWGTHFLVTGRIRVYRLQNNEVRELAVWPARSIAGYLPFSRGKVAAAFGEALEDTQIMSLPIEKSPELIRTHFELTQALVHMMTDRVREYTSFQQQNEKMMALGKLSAGLAHELNNPAAAIVRGAESLKKHLQLEPTTFREIMAIKATPEQVDMVSKLLFSILHGTEKPVLTLMQRSDKEDELLDWLDDHNVANSQEVAENMVEFGFTLDNLEEFKQHVQEKDLSPVFNWINSNLVKERMVLDIEEASKRIATLVGSVKVFTHMDQGHDKELTDIHSGIRNTLVILQHRLRKGNVELVENFDNTLPQIKALIGEMNQVWTNLIDNALDAMEPNKKGVLEIQTSKDRHCVYVSIIDNGPGIPEEIRSRVFDPFFTTKGIGKGTGMGLDIVMQIVRQHNGNVKAISEPGRTEFKVSLPIQG
ncbi:sensor histidine kinase [Chitinophaga sp. GbtcB8]|uniref:sensor histidine kinase n=1 Tax=Chitinophaga sp. GbtcB8 TaxID=2824753 RepID=UPI001C3047B5|nr:ATP-binding protein [Chitinophaga sp. GbtcB8]